MTTEATTEETRRRGDIDLETFFGALADRTRLRLLNLMRGGEICVCYFVEGMRAPQPTISRHLAHLRRAGLVNARRDGKWMHYSIAEPADEGMRTILHDTLARLAGDPEMARDRERIVRACCSPRTPITLEGAPRPQGFQEGGE